MKTILILLTTITISGCGIAQVVTNVATNPIGAISDTTGKIISSGFEAARPNQGYEYNYPYQNTKN